MRTIYKYSRAREFYDTLQSPHSVKEMHDLLGVGLEFQDLGMAKIESYHPIPGTDSLIGRLNERRPSNQDIPPSLEQYIEEIGTVDFVKDTPMDTSRNGGCCPCFKGN